jgi:predicted aminopeptidase
MRWWFTVPLLTVAGVVVSACALPYYTQAVGGQIGLLRQRVPIEEIVVDPNYDAMTRDRLKLVTSLRRFAVDELALPDNASYTSYVDLERDYVVWNVVAAEEFSIEPVTWCFPIAGCVAYRGYFDRDKAESFERKLSERGYDTYSGGSAAYSTLGYFDDPVLNTMLLRGDVEVAATLFHELAHQRLYVKSDTELSESLATAVEQYAVEEWLKSSNRVDDLAQFRSRLERRRDFAGLVAEQRARLTRLFASDLDPTAMRAAKRAAYEQMRSDYEDLKQSWGGSGDYDRWFASDLNNAKLVAVTSYERWVPGLRRRLELLGPEAFFAEMESLSELEAEVKTARLEAWNAASVMTSLADRR